MALLSWVFLKRGLADYSGVAPNFRKTLARLRTRPVDPLERSSDKLWLLRVIANLSWQNA
jgi:hypothetical protein